MSAGLVVRRIERRRFDKTVESVEFRRGVNLLLGVPNSGKTTWLRMLDFVLADPDAPEEKLDPDILEKYEAIVAHLEIGPISVVLERAWAGAGPKTKISLNNDPLTPKEVQHGLLELTQTPLLNFPRGNPFSGQTWPELSFRMLLRHIYRQQRYWGDIVDLQPEGERTACILQFLGSAELIFTEEYGRLVKAKIELEQLRARRVQFSATLNDLAREIVVQPAAQVAVTRQSLSAAEEELNKQLATLEEERDALITSARDKAVLGRDRESVIQMSEERAQLLSDRDELLIRIEEGKKRAEELSDYLHAVREECERLSRAEDASIALADIRITHCPACDQSISDAGKEPGTCVLCGQALPESMSQFSKDRLAFERERVKTEIVEAKDLVEVMQKENRAFQQSLAAVDERLDRLEQELRPAKTAVSALVQQALSVMDRKAGELSERLRQLQRIKGAVELGEKLAGQIQEKENEIAPLQDQVDANLDKVDFIAIADVLAEGMTDYLNAINRVRPNTWKHSRAHLRVTESKSKFLVGEKQWANALGGTDQLYFLMAYQYALMTLANKKGTHYPGLAIIDTPGEFAGESIRDLENFIVEPFIELLGRDDMQDAQVIITGSAFQGLPAAHRVELRTVWTA